MTIMVKGISTVNGRTVERELTDGEPGGAESGLKLNLAKMDFAFNTPGLKDGVAFYTPKVGDILLDVWIEVSEAWDAGVADVGTFVGAGEGVWGQSGNWGPADMTKQDSEVNGAGLLMNRGRGSASAGTNASDTRPVPSRFVGTNPLKVAVFTGTAPGTAPSTTKGSARVYALILQA